MLVIPLKAPQPINLTSALSQYLDNTENEVGLASSDVQSDLRRLSELRNTLCEVGNNWNASLEVIEAYMQYHASLLECEDKGFPLEESPETQKYLHFTWTPLSPTSSPETHSTFVWERANVLWNICGLNLYEAVMWDKSTKTGWRKAAQLLQSAASVMAHLSKMDPARLSLDFRQVSFWQTYLLAEAQIATYSLAKAAPNPNPFLLAKLSMAAVPLLEEAASLVDADTTKDYEDSPVVYCKAWSLYLAAAAEYHAATSHLQKDEFGAQLVRLQRSKTYLTQCHDYLNSQPNNILGSKSLQPMKRHVVKLQSLQRDQFQAAQQRPPSRSSTNNQKVQDIVGELVPKANAPLPAAMVAPQHLMGPSLSAEAKQALARFTKRAQEVSHQLGRRASQLTELGQSSLQQVDLPHSLTAYKQQTTSGGGIPPELWRRVEQLQQEERVTHLQRQLWELKDAAEAAQSLYSRVNSQLKEDAEMDRLFRQEHRSFEGRDVPEVQRTFTSSLQQYEQFLNKSREGDSVLLRRLEALETDSKFRLLSYKRDELDRLLPSRGDSALIDTSYLSRLLVDLSTLFRERETLVQKLQQEAKRSRVRHEIGMVDPKRPDAESRYNYIIKSAQDYVEGLSEDLQQNFSQQTQLLDTILGENDVFVAAREATMGTFTSEESSCISMIEDALEEVEQLTKHLKEGCDFYKVIMPKLEQLQSQVAEVSARLAAERFEFEDNGYSNPQAQRQQEESDHRMAETYAGDSGGAVGAHQSYQQAPSGRNTPPREFHISASTSRPGPSRPSSNSGGSSSHPGVVPVNHNEPQVQVDDQKVASLVGMEFDPQKVVNALRRYDNNVEQALNDLLMGNDSEYHV